MAEEDEACTREEELRKYVRLHGLVARREAETNKQRVADDDALAALRQHNDVV
eukprot:SAG31_NODE_47264_length_251_cov_0.671053_1_plen_52_part_10